jgi:hypothetical protein
MIEHMEKCAEVGCDKAQVKTCLGWPVAKHNKNFFNGGL